MKINNKKKIARLKRMFYMVSVLIAIAALVLFLFDFVIYGIACAGLFGLWFLWFQVADFQYIEFSDENNKVLLRYYKAIKLGKTEFNAIEFPQGILKKAWFENSVFGQNSDLTLIVKTKRGVAEYPSVSLAALSKEERNKIKVSLTQILEK